MMDAQPLPVSLPNELPFWHAPCLYYQHAVDTPYHPPVDELMSIIVEGESPELAASQSNPANGQRLVAGRFRLLDQLGRGGMGRVYRAHDEILNRPVAVKLIYDDAVRDRELQHACALEARAAARLNHPGIVRILDSGFDDGHCYVVMSLAEGRTLAEIIREDGPLELDRALDLGIQVADALAAAHQEGVIHCDVKPGNLLVDADWRIRLVDFGIARITSSTTGLTGELLQGSAQYVAPEQVEGASVDGRTDLYALGTVLYEMLAGKTPFGGGTIASILARRLVNDPPSLRSIVPTVPPRVEQVILKALARDPARRFQTTAELRDALMAIRQEVPHFPLPGTEREQTSRLPLWVEPRFSARALPRFDWELASKALLQKVSRIATRTADVGRQAGRSTSTRLPDAMTRARLLTPSHRPTLRAGIALAVVVGLLVGTAAAKCGVAGVAAETAVAADVVEIIPTPITAPPEPYLAPAISEPIAQIAPTTATQPPQPTPVPPTATAPTATTAPTVAVADVAPVQLDTPPAPVQAVPPPAVRALSAPPPAPAAPVQAEPPPPPAEEPKPEQPAQPPSRSESPKPESASRSSDDDNRRPLSNTPRSDDKTPEERQKAELKRFEAEKQAAPPKPEPPKQESKKPDPPKPPEPPKQETKKPDPPKQETKKSEQGGNGEKKKR
jgi:eukaryotic-like serine/threonine-protein kinase